MEREQNTRFGVLKGRVELNDRNRESREDYYRYENNQGSLDLSRAGDNIVIECFTERFIEFEACGRHGLWPCFPCTMPKIEQ